MINAPTTIPSMPLGDDGDPAIQIETMSREIEQIGLGSLLEKARNNELDNEDLTALIEITKCISQIIQMLESGNFGSYIPIRKEDERLGLVQKYYRLLNKIINPYKEDEFGGVSYFPRPTTYFKSHDDVEESDVTLKTYEFPINTKYKIIKIEEMRIKDNTHKILIDLVRNDGKLAEEWFSIVRI